MRVDVFDFDLPEDRIALRPCNPRDAARMLLVDPASRLELTDGCIRDLPRHLSAGDIVVFNDTKVISARLAGRRVSRGGGAGAAIEVTLHKRLDEARWLAFARPARKLALADRLRFGGEGEACLAGTLDATVEAKGEAGEVTLAFDFHGGFLDDAVKTLGRMPLPPYIATRRTPDEDDIADYQTVYARHEGAVAAPTAGLHFTPELLGRLEAAGIDLAMVTLHVGAGTFLPVKADNTADHLMHAEWGEVTPETASRINALRARGGRVVAVGTTALRLLESAVDSQGSITPFRGETDIFITPGFRFRAVDMLVTNFHLPRSTLFMLVCAFCGVERMRRAYAHAIQEGYRFYSYGDACLLRRAEEGDRT